MTVKSEGWIAFWMLFIVTLVGSLVALAIDGEGAWTANTYNSTTDISFSNGNDNFVHTKDDLYIVPYVSSADELWIAHKPTTGGSWEYAEITSTYSGYVTVGALCSSNNTLIVYASEARPTVNGMIWIKWPGSDWDDWIGYSVETGTVVIFDFSINNTDVICFSYRNSNFCYLELFNLTTLTTSGRTDFDSGTNVEISVESNQSGDFWTFYGSTPSNHFLQDYNKSVAAVQKTGYWSQARLVCLPNDRFGVTSQYIFGAYKTLYWMYQSSHGGAFTSVIITPQATSDSWSWSPKAILTQDSLTVYILAMDSTDSKLYEYHASWAAIASTWQASEVEVTSSGTHFPLGASNSVWPKTAGLSWCQPATGQAIHVMNYGAGSPYPMQIWTQSVTWTPDLTTAWPEITTAGLDQGTYGELYSFSMSRSGGTSPFEWTIVSGPVWLEIGLATGILSGTPTGIGTFVVQIQLADVIPRTDTESFNLKINSAVTEGGSEATEGFSAEDLELASLWLILATAAIGVGLAREFKRYTHPKVEPRPKYVGHMDEKGDIFR